MGAMCNSISGWTRIAGCWGSLWRWGRCDTWCAIRLSSIAEFASLLYVMLTLKHISVFGNSMSTMKNLNRECYMICSALQIHIWQWSWYVVENVSWRRGLRWYLRMFWHRYLFFWNPQEFYWLCVCLWYAKRRSASEISPVYVWWWGWKPFWSKQIPQEKMR